MALFPLFIDLSDKNVLIVGGGEIARHKVEKLLPFSPKLTVVAREAHPEIAELHHQQKLKLELREFVPTDLEEKFVVIAAVDCPQVHQRIYQLCQQRGIICNSVDNAQYCDFIFPSLVVRPNYTIGITTAGKAPAMSAEIRKYLERHLSSQIDEFITQVEQLRQELPKGEERQKRVISLAKQLMSTLPN